MSLGRDSFIPAGLQGSFRSPQTTTCSEMMREAPGSGNFSASIYEPMCMGLGFSRRDEFIVGELKEILPS